MPAEPVPPEFRQDAFDTAKLGCRVFKLWLHEDAPEAAVLAQIIDASAADLVCCFSAYSAPNIALVQSLGFRLISVRQTYERDLVSEMEIPVLAGFEVSLAQPGESLEPLRLRSLAEIIGLSSRYFKDPGIPRARSQALYEAWLSNSLSGYADAVVLGKQGDDVLGIHTLRIGQGVGVVDLIGVEARAQSSGLGSALLLHGLRECAGRGVVKARVVTEGENVGASRFYQRHGFLLCSTELVWHWHRRRK
jgi:ribosomal protein S18 acetylase RimI-like enzyme